MTTTDARALPAAAQADLRWRTVKAVRDGMTQTEAARVFGVARPTVTKWVTAYETGSAAALKAKRRRRPPGTQLAPHQAALTVRLITDRCPPISSGSPSPSGPGRRSSTSLRSDLAWRCRSGP